MRSLKSSLSKGVLYRFPRAAKELWAKPVWICEREKMSEWSWSHFLGYFFPLLKCWCSWKLEFGYFSWVTNYPALPLQFLIFSWEVLWKPLALKLNSFSSKPCFSFCIMKLLLSAQMPKSEIWQSSEISYFPLFSYFHKSDNHILSMFA